MDIGRGEEKLAEKNKEIDKKKKKIEPNSIKLQMAGDLLLGRFTDRELTSLYQRYENLLEKFANMDRDERVINYKFFVGLILTSHAKKAKDVETKKTLFDLKNEIYLNLANNKSYRKKLGFRYLTSKNFRVLEFCKKCEEKNEKENLQKHQWKFCMECKVDRKFYNVLSVHHKFDGGSATMYLSNDLLHKVENIRVTQKGKLEDFVEEARFHKYHYNIRNLDVFEQESVRSIQKKLLTI